MLWFTQRYIAVLQWATDRVSRYYVMIRTRVSRSGMRFWLLYIVRKAFLCAGAILFATVR